MAPVSQSLRDPLGLRPMPKTYIKLARPFRWRYRDIRFCHGVAIRILYVISRRIAGTSESVVAPILAAWPML